MTLNEPNYYLTDSSGNRIGAIGVDTDGNPVVEHVESGQQVAVTASGLEADSGTFDSLSTEQATIAGSGTRDLEWEHLDSADGGTSVSLNVSGYSVYYVDYILQFDDVSGDNLLRFNGDSASNYQYFDETGAKTTGANGIPFLTVTSNGFWRGGGSIILFDGRNDEAGINNQVGGGRIDRLAGYADVGGWLDNTDISSVDFELLSNSVVAIDVWGAVDR